ncbi:MAG: polyphosphate kinase 2 [Phaeodactylibacter sp.]|nr:polyphosphate kinase 2 [Phaeodactylibacter sp.]MCB9301954.1 polyphosphate kinase 2 [Lewinellaceae bacterium]HQU58070.1 polyphosphate kinase 2 [Saprospiraceae bacterium]
MEQDFPTIPGQDAIFDKQVLQHYSVNPAYVHDLYYLQVELLKLQKHIHEHGLRLAILFEGRDTAGKGGAIFRFSQFLNPRHYRVVALGKPSEVEKGQWYFQRYIQELPNAGEIVFFDRSWYNRAVVEPVMGFCTPEQYELFLQQAPLFEKMIIDDGIILVKFWFSIDMEVQRHRIEDRLTDPLKQWKVSPIDLLAQEKWHEFTKYKNRMYELTSMPYSPWVITKGNIREAARIAAMRYLLYQIDYNGKSPDLALPEPELLWVHEPKGARK